MPIFVVFKDIKIYVKTLFATEPKRLHNPYMARRG